MGRKANTSRIEAIGRYVDTHPGSKPIDIARGLGLEPSSVTRLLPALQDEGILLSEDKKGRLWPFRKQREQSGLEFDGFCGIGQQRVLQCRQVIRPSPGGPMELGAILRRARPDHRWNLTDQGREP